MIDRSLGEADLEMPDRGSELPNAHQPLERSADRASADRAAAADEPADRRPGRRLPRPLTAVLIAALPMIVGLYVAATAFGGTLLPWQPTLTDLAVYRLAGATLLTGGDIYHLPNSLPFLYPPFAALLAVPLSLLPTAVAEIGWTMAGVAALLLIMRRLGVRGWSLSLLGTAVIWFVEPVNQTLAYGQVGIFLVALVVMDLVPRRPGDSGHLAGALTGLAAAIKLTPGLFFLVLIAGRRKRASVGVLVSFLIVTVATAAVVPQVSIGYWSRLAHGDTGLGHSIIYTTNQSVLGAWLRWFGLGQISTVIGLAACGLVALLGVVSAVVWLRRGEAALGVTLGGVATLLASPVSWSHHFVWVVPLGLLLLHSRASASFRAIGFVFVGWVSAAPFEGLPRGGDIELTYTWTQNLLASVTPLLGLVLLISGVFAGRGVARADEASIDSAEDEGR